MREITGEVFALAAADDTAWAVVTTNGCVQRSGRLIMGAGIAKQAAQRHPHLPAVFGALVKEHGNVPVADPKSRVLSWPTKPDTHRLPDGTSHAGWMCAARVKHPECVRQVARLVWGNAPRIVALANELDITGPIYTPTPGCGLGGLNWGDVQPHLAGVLDDRFVIVAPA